MGEAEGVAVQAWDGVEVKASDRLEQLERAIAVLQSFDRDHPALTVSDAARITHISRAAARRILLTFQSLGLVRSDGRNYSLTPKVLSIGWDYFATLGLDEVARPIIADVVARLDQTCSVTILDLPDIVFVARVHSRKITALSGGVGSKLPAQATANGRALMSGLEDAQIDEYLERNPLVRYTDRTIVDIAKFRDELSAVREQGWSIVDQEMEVGLLALAIPLEGKYGETRAALGVSSNTLHSSREELLDVSLPVLQEAGQQISVALSRSDHRGPFA
ncbi:MAG TPA: IclR family transcriptional regulator C-terminal domain-containing protein [Microbacteriaceae bacterium]|nr:IclR family transcriptional regulator C-terminal domain-containing protein [Microbacteriaceae bacterium]